MTTLRLPAYLMLNAMYGEYNMHKPYVTYVEKKWGTLNIKDHSKELYQLHPKAISHTLHNRAPKNLYEEGAGEDNENEDDVSMESDIDEATVVNAKRKPAREAIPPAKNKRAKLCVKDKICLMSEGYSPLRLNRGAVLFQDALNRRSRSSRSILANRKSAHATEQCKGYANPEFASYHATNGGNAANVGITNALQFFAMNTDVSLDNNETSDSLTGMDAMMFILMLGILSPAVKRIKRCVYTARKTVYRSICF